MQTKSNAHNFSPLGGLLDSTSTYFHEKKALDRELEIVLPNIYRLPHFFYRALAFGWL
jgi:hypothetical protein